MKFWSILHLGLNAFGFDVPLYLLVPLRDLNSATPTPTPTPTNYNIPPKILLIENSLRPILYNKWPFQQTLLNGVVHG